jgi:hypothetical protein
MREGLGSNAHGQAGAVISAIKSHTELDTAGRLALVAGSLGHEHGGRECALHRLLLQAGDTPAVAEVHGRRAVGL